jgi:U4/U6 small nuclear ribonucleoprotein PRP3
LADAITSFIQHPRALASLIEAPPAPPVALRLTRAEAKKVRRRRRLEKQQEITDKIRLGLMAAPEPRVKLSNMATVLRYPHFSDRIV